MDVPILFEDASFLAIDKPVGVVVNRAESVKGETIQDWMDARYPTLFVHHSGEMPEETAFIDRSGVVHRIDKETSGILLLAKTIPAFVELQRQFKERIIHKTYMAIVHGELVPATGEVRAPVGRLPWNKERFGIVPGGKESVTHYEVIKTFTTKEGEKLSLVTLHPETGRTHQIRVHMKYINHPLLGDYLYAGRKTSRDDRGWAPRVMLHAARIMLKHPETGKDIAIDAPIPDDMNRIIS